MPIANVADRPLSELASLAGRTAVITGAGAGIGRATARRLAEAGARIIATDLNREAAQETIANLPGDGHIACHLDVSNNADIEEIARETAGGVIDIWINLAGIYPVTHTLDLPPEEWNRILDINLNGTFFGARAAARHMAASGRPGVIVNCISSVLDKISNTGLVAYMASKGAVKAITRAMAFEFGPQNIRVLAVAPTITKTEGVIAQKQDLMSAMGEDPHELYASRLPLRRMCESDDVARAILFMVSDMAVMMTGSVVYVDGGDAIC